MNSAQRPANSQRQIRKIQTAADDILDSAEYRQHQQQQHFKGAIHSTIYELAKSAETNERNLPKAVELYAEAASKGEKIDSCIKDFASILHQMGETEIAVKFLKDARPYYHGDLPKFDRLMTTLEKQLAPSGKHHCKTLLLELPKPEEPSEELIQSMFTNVTRIKAVRAYNHLDFSQEPEQRGKWFVLDFESFSAAKKTLQKFVYQEWFGINKFWMKGNSVACMATDGREDFEQGFIMNEGQLHKWARKGEGWMLGEGVGNLQWMNEVGIGLIEKEEYLGCTSSQGEE